MDRTQAFFRDKAVLITEASSAIGEELAWRLGGAGAMLTLAARRREHSRLSHLDTRRFCP